MYIQTLKNIFKNMCTYSVHIWTEFKNNILLRRIKVSLLNLSKRQKTDLILGHINPLIPIYV